MSTRSGMQRGPSPRAGEGLLHADRLVLLQGWRAVAVGLVLAGAVLLPASLAGGRADVVAVTLGYTAGVLGAELVRRRRGAERLHRALFPVLLAADALWLAAAAYASSGVASPVRYLVLLHVAAVALLVPGRAVAALALAHSALLTVVHLRHDAPAGSGGARPDGGAPELVVLLVVLWLVAATTRALAARADADLRRRSRDLETLTAFADRVERTSDSRSVGRLLVECATETAELSRAVVVAGPEGPLPLLAAHGLPEATVRRPGRPAGSAVVAAACESAAPQEVDALDPAEEPWLSRLLPDARRLVVVPLVAEGRPLGALVVEPAGPHARLPADTVSALERVAAHAALALRNAWLLEQVQRLAATDGLTKIANRRTFESTLERELARATRSAEHVSLVMVDIDHFKQLNDAHGHQAGDEVLRNVAAALTIECRDFDTAARYGGEEFAVVLPGCGPDEAVAIAERLRRAVAAAPSVVPITASAGVATYPSHAGDADTLVRAADEALYTSKRAGRDRTTQSTGVPPEAQVDALLRRAVSHRLGRAASGTDAPGRPRARPE